MNKAIVMVVGGVEQLLRFSRDVRVAPYKRYVQDREAEKLAHRVHLTERKPTRITKQKLLPALHFVTGTEAGTDDGGVFIWSSVNPEARFQAFRQVGAFMAPECVADEDFGKLLYESTVLVHDGQWIQGGFLEVLPEGMVHFYEVELLDHRTHRKLPVKRLREMAAY